MSAEPRDTPPEPGPWDEVRQAQGKATHHADEARRWADLANKFEADGDQTTAYMCTALANAHGSAAIATVLAAGIVSNEEVT